MLENQPWMRNMEYIPIELAQSADEGKIVEDYKKRAEDILNMDGSDLKTEAFAGELVDELAALPVEKDFPYVEPSDLEGIKKARPPKNKNEASLAIPNDEVLYDKIYGAWLGRCSGCLLGKPVEGWHMERIRGLQKETGNYPFSYYISSDISPDIKQKYQMDDNRAWINKVECAPEDDDTNYTIIGLKILKTYGYSFTPYDVAETWLRDLPFLHLCTAERVAYRNFINRIFPPHSASYRNPYREWIGAQIRGDFFGYVSPGEPELGAEMAWRDASISHTKNGIYGEMMVAAMLSWAACTDDIEAIIKGGLGQIPRSSRLAEKILEVLAWKREGINWEEAVQKVHEIYDEKNSHHWCHTISNAMIVCIALLFGELDFEKSIGIAVSAGFDTDCNGATVGSIVGMILGAEKLPEKWIKPLNNELRSGVDGFNRVKISDLAAMTMDIIKSRKFKASTK